eukprot:598520_1
MSDQPTKKLYDEMDLRIFGQQGRQKCDQDCDDPIEGCIVVKRLVVALAYYSHLDVQNSKDGQHIFMAFINDVYPHILEDYAHLVKKHTNLEAINNALRAKKVFDVCEVAKCACTARHQSRETTKPSEQSSDAIVQFYSQLMDSLHFYLLHLFECGLRTPNVTPNDDDNDDKKEDHDQYFDKQFARVSRMVNERHHIRLSFGRFKTNTKFNIQAAAATDESSNTVYMDEVVRYLLYSEVEEDTIRQFAQFVAFHEYDVDSMTEDIKQASPGNIAVNIGDAEVIKALAEFVQASELRSSSFNIGLTFYYWPEYEKMDAFDANTNSSNLNDHGGYEVRDLFVKRRHVSFKEEIMAYAFVSMAKYEVIMTKVKEYLKTNSVKQIKAYNESGEWNLNIVLKYGIPHGSVLFSRHLLALFLYTDCTDLCTHFSATFRANKQYEALSAIKARNSKYWWMAKSLREMVELYGDRKEWDDDEDEWIGFKGPFYCGLSAVMPFPEFEVRLCGPTSTSYQIETAINFAGKEGVVVQLDNMEYSHGYLSGFPCAWLSDFKEEDEVLFMGGHYRIKIESVRILKGKGGQCQNFEVFFGALCKFNKMFNGDYAKKEGHRSGEGVSSDERLILSSLIKWKMGQKEAAGKIDRYVLDTFQSFCQNKQLIVLDYDKLCRWNDESLRDLIFYGMNETERAKEEKTNIFRKDLFQIFQNIKNIEIYATGDTGYFQYAFSFASLLSEIEEEHWTQLKVKGVHHWKTDNKSWIGVLWSSSSKELKEECQKKK